MTRRSNRHLPLQAYLLGVMVAAALAGSALAVAQNQIRLEKARNDTSASMKFVADLAATDIAEAVESARDTTAGVAANPGLAALFGTTPIPQGCSLDFTGAGPFTEGHIDIVDRSGEVLCSSRDLPGGRPYEGAAWLESESARVVGPVKDADGQALVTVAPIQDLGQVAVFLAIDSLPEELANRYGAQRAASFEVAFRNGQSATSAQLGPDAISRTSAIPSLGWTVRAGTPEATALRDAHETNRQMTLAILFALGLMLVLIELVYLGIARPIRRLSTSVRQATSGHGTVEPPQSGPAEVVSLGNDFATMTQTVASELAQREQAEEEAQVSEHRYRTIFEANPQPTWVHHAETGQLLAVNTAMAAHFGWTQNQLLSMSYQELIDDHSAELNAALTGSAVVERSGPWKMTARDGSTLECLVTSAPLDLPGTPGRIVVAEDVTVQRHTERLLHRSERMDSLGQLAGGIAHDFNNVLAVMLNYADFATQELATAVQEDPDRWGLVLTDVREILTAGERAAELTRQLLAFARGDALETGPVNINDVATGVEHLLRRTLGEHVTLEFTLDPDLWPVEANVGQLEQVIVNLAVNARDAMPTGGSLTIETVNVDVDEEYATSRPERPPGRYVRLRVTDTGAGMDAAARDRAFEPFFTTKDRAAGTGLGLATVYGVVRRADGTIDIYSEPGHGTTISMYLPATGRPVESPPTPATPIHHKPGKETVLLVEDDEALRALAQRILHRDGYQVLTAEDGANAETIAAERAGNIDLLLTDVIMPGMLGSELAQRVTRADPNLKVLFMSGYSPPALINAGTLPFNALMVDKPFSADLLLAKVRQALDAQTTGEDLS